jgi:hypothetical protein
MIWEIQPGSPRPTELKVEIVGIHPRLLFLGLLKEFLDHEDVDGVATVPVTS